MDSIDIGTAAVPFALGTSLILRAVEVYTSSASVAAGTSVRPIYALHTVLAAGGVGHRAEFHTRCNVAAGTWINALKGYMEFDNAAGTGVGGRTTGLASAICAEMLWPDAAVGTGHYFCMELEAVGQTNSGTGVMSGFLTARASGTLTNFNANAFLLHVGGMTAAAGAMVSANSQTLKCYIGALTRYMVMSTAENTLALAHACASGGYGASVVGTLTSGASDGIAAYFEGHVAGTPTGNCFGTGAWLNIDGVTGGFNMRALDVGVWTDQNLGGVGTVYGINIGIHLGAAGAPNVAYQMRFNHSGHALTAWWHASGAGAVAWTGGADTGATKTGDLAVQVGGTVHYIRTWDGIS